MCPACVMNAGVVIGGAVSGGGIVAVIGRMMRTVTLVDWVGWMRRVGL